MVLPNVLGFWNSFILITFDASFLWFMSARMLVNECEQIMGSTAHGADRRSSVLVRHSTFVKGKGENPLFAVALIVSLFCACCVSGKRHLCSPITSECHAVVDDHAQVKLRENGPTAPMELLRRAIATSVVAAVLNHHVDTRLVSHVKVAKALEKALQTPHDSTQTIRMFALSFKSSLFIIYNIIL